MRLPDVLRMCNGKEVVDTKVWEQERRPEILELFRAHVYGREPSLSAASIRFETAVTDGWMNGTAVRKKIMIHIQGPYGAHAFPVYVFVPVKAAKPVPAFPRCCRRTFPRWEGSLMGRSDR